MEGEEGMCLLKIPAGPNDHPRLAETWPHTTHTTETLSHPMHLASPPPVNAHHPLTRRICTLATSATCLLTLQQVPSSILNSTQNFYAWISRKSQNSRKILVASIWVYWATLIHPTLWLLHFFYIQNSFATSNVQIKSNQCCVPVSLYSCWGCVSFCFALTNK